MSNGSAGTDAVSSPGGLGEATPSAYLLGVVLAVGVVLPGVGSYLLSTVGYDALATLVWVLGYAGAVAVVWYVWVRPLDIVGPE